MTSLNGWSDLCTPEKLGAELDAALSSLSAPTTKDVVRRLFIQVTGRAPGQRHRPYRTHEYERIGRAFDELLFVLTGYQKP